MFAKNLECVLGEALDKSDVSPVDLADITERFESLRRYGRLPRGRENRAKVLNVSEIAAAVLGVVTLNPKWAGHAVTILTDLRPVGGSGAAFRGSSDLSAAIEHLLSDRSARECLVSLAVSVAESATNANGFATMVYEEGVARRRTSFVSKMAVSKLQPGAEGLFDPERLNAPASRCVIFSRAFFEHVARAIARASAFPTEPAGDGSEYDAEEARRARFEALGVQRGSRFLNVGVDTQVTWPKQEMLVRFDRHQLVLMPKTKENTQSVHVDLVVNRLSDKEALTLINRFLSTLAWCDDQFAVAQGGWSGNPVPVPVPKRDLAFATAHQWVFDRRVPQSEDVRRALALFREGANAEAASLGSYAVLSYFKVMEIKFADAAGVRKWIGANFHEIALEAGDDPQFKHFIAECQGQPPAEYINKACRVAVAHASEKYPSDVDDANEATRLYSAAHVLRLLARRFITKELGVSQSVYSGE